ncbi:MAG: transcriptional regulator [Thaumarchaeota archaeon]|nr:transcriptional regulator [Nitrososphaerota archaeon]
MVQESQFVKDSLTSIKNFEKVNEISTFSPEVFNPYRLVILFGLKRAGFQNVQQLKRLTKIQSDGNLASHLKSLEKQGLIEYYRSFAGRRPLIFYYLTPLAEELIVELVDRLKNFLAGFDE